MKPRIVKIEFEDYGFKYFHEGYTAIYYQESAFVLRYEVSVRELELMMFGC